jgi:hypothetical protein
MYSGRVISFPTQDGVGYLVVSQKVGRDQVVERYRFDTAGGRRLDDGQWHDLRVTKNARTVSGS